LVNIQIHTTQVGETLASISKQYNISVDTIKWANNLTNDTIKPGWYLKIPPVNGILLVVGANTTGPDIAHKYNANLKEIIAYNGLEDYNDFEKGDVIMVPNGKMPAAVAAAKPAKPGSTIKLPGKDTSLPKGKGHIFVSGQCTDYVARKFSAEGRAIEFGGNAKDWPANAKAYGATFDKNPVKGAILVTTDNRRYGHVAYIDSVNGNTVTISEWNYAGPYKLTKRTLSMSDSSVRGVIHYKE
jgi:surface antigen